MYCECIQCVKTIKNFKKSIQLRKHLFHLGMQVNICNLES